MSQIESINGIQKTIIPRIISVIIINVRLFIRSIKEPATKFVNTLAVGPTTKTPAIAAGDSVKCHTNKLSATR